MDFEAVLHQTLYIGVLLIGLPLAAGAAYYSLLLHQAVKNEERYGELLKRQGRREERLRRMEEAKRLSDPFFHFKVNSNPTLDEAVQERLAVERGTMKMDKGTKVVAEREARILKAIEEGRLVMLETPLEECAVGMVLGKPIAEAGLHRGDEISAELLEECYEAGWESLPVLYNPSKVAGAMAGSAA